MSTRRLLLPVLLALLAAYLVAHSPLPAIFATGVGMSSHRCYFTCADWIAKARPFDALGAIAGIALATAAGWIVFHRFGGRLSDRAIIFALTALAFATVPAAFLGTIGWAFDAKSLQPPWGPVFAALPAAAFVAWGVANRQPLVPLQLALRPQGLILLLAGIVVIILSASSAISLGHPPTGYDALSYHAPIAVYFWRDGDLAGFLERQPWAPALAHPGTAELWFGLLRLAGGEAAANLGQLPFALLGATAVYVFGRRAGLPRVAAELGGLGFLLAPIVIAQSGMQLNDLAAGAVLMAAMALAASPPTEWSRGRLAFIGLALGLAATTKLAMLPGVLAIWLYLLAGCVRAQRPLRILAPAAATFIIVVAPWWTRNIVLFGNPLYPAALPFIGRGYVVGDFMKKDGWFVPTPLAWPLYPLIERHSEMSGLGALFTVGAIPGLLIAFGKAKRGPLALYGLAVVLSLTAWWLLTQHEPRLLLPIFGIGFAFLGWTLVAVPRRQRAIACGVLGAAACFSGMVTADQVLRPLALAPTGRWEFYDRVWGIDSTVAMLPEREGILYHTGHAKLSYAGDYPLLGPSLGRIIASLDSVIPTDSIVETMRRQGFRYAYVPAAPEAQAAVEAMYSPPRFELVHASVVTTGDRSGTRRYLYRLITK